MKMKVILKGGSCIEVDLSKQTLAINASKVCIVEPLEGTKDGVTDFVIPFSILDKLEIVYD